MAATHVALLRGINVGRAKRVGMADLRAAVERLGYTGVRTLLNSGNVVFTARGAAPDAASRIEAAVRKDIGVTSRVTVLTAEELAAVVKRNPLGAVANNPSRHLVVVLTDPLDRKRLTLLARRDWTPEALALGARVVHVWCPEGVIESRAFEAVGREVGDGMTSRNWATMTKLHALCQDTEVQPAKPRR